MISQEMAEVLAEVGKSKQWKVSSDGKWIILRWTMDGVKGKRGKK